MEKLDWITIQRYNAQIESEDDRLLQKLKTRKLQVKYILKTYPESRNNDFFLKWLWLRIIAKIDVPFVTWNKIQQHSGQLESVRRVRQKIQNTEKQFPPTDPKVIKARRWKSETMRRVIKDV